MIKEYSHLKRILISLFSTFSLAFISYSIAHCQQEPIQSMPLDNRNLEIYEKGNGKKILIDADTKEIVLDTKFNIVSYKEEFGLVIVRNNSYLGVVDLTGKMILPYLYYNLYFTNFNRKTAYYIVGQLTSDRYTNILMDLQGKPVLVNPFMFINERNDCLQVTFKNNSNVLYDFNFNLISSLYSYRVPIQKGDILLYKILLNKNKNVLGQNKYSLMNKNSKIISTELFADAKFLDYPNCNLIHVRKYDNVNTVNINYLVDENFKRVNSKVYNIITELKGIPFIKVSIEVKKGFSTNWLTGLLDLNGNTVIPCILDNMHFELFTYYNYNGNYLNKHWTEKDLMDSIANYENSFIARFSNGMYGIYSNKGKLITSTQYDKIELQRPTENYYIENKENMPFYYECTLDGKRYFLNYLGQSVTLTKTHYEDQY